MQPRKALNLVMFLLILATTPFLYGQTSEVDDNPDRGGIRFERVAVPPLVGSWVIDVQADPPFNAFHTFHAGGTMSETTNLLATLAEGPAHGVWQKEGDDYATTFELFIFEPDHTPAGRIRVRETITLEGNDRFIGFSVADLILPDGTVIENIGAGPIIGTRISVRPVKAEEKLARPNASWGTYVRGRW